jgi:hypothetical protein
MKKQHGFMTQAKAFLAAVGYPAPRRSSQYLMAQYWTANQTEIVKATLHSRPSLVPNLLHLFGKITITASYLADLKAMPIKNEKLEMKN